MVREVVTNIKHQETNPQNMGPDRESYYIKSFLSLMKYYQETQSTTCFYVLLFVHPSSTLPSTYRPGQLFPAVAI